MKGQANGMGPTATFFDSFNEKSVHRLVGTQHKSTSVHLLGP